MEVLRGGNDTYNRNTTQSVMVASTRKTVFNTALYSTGMQWSRTRMTWPQKERRKVLVPIETAAAVENKGSWAEIQKRVQAGRKNKKAETQCGTGRQKRMRKRKWKERKDDPSKALKHGRWISLERGGNPGTAATNTKHRKHSSWRPILQELVLLFLFAGERKVQ